MALPRPAKPRPADVRRPGSRAVHAAIRRFATGPLRQRTLRAAAASDRVADLALSFPGALAVIATGERGREQTQRAEALVIGGAPLREVARALGLPLWLRRLPPEAFGVRIPPLPDTAEFRCRIANHLPKRARDAGAWLAWCAAATAACDEHFAIWAAREFSRQKIHGPAEGIEAVGMFAWYSQRPDLEAAAVMRRRWSPAMSLDEACMEADTWLERLECAVVSGVRGYFRTPCSYQHDGLQFSRLSSPAEYFVASSALDNCLGTYALSWEADTEVWTVSDGGAMQAALEIEIDRKHAGPPTLSQVRGTKNEPAPPRVLKAIYRLLAEWPAVPDIRTPTVPAMPDAAAYRRLLKPYWLEKKRHHLVPLAPEKELFDGIQSALARLRYPRRRQRRPA